MNKNNFVVYIFGNSLAAAVLGFLAYTFIILASTVVMMMYSSVRMYTET